MKPECKSHYYYINFHIFNEWDKILNSSFKDLNISHNIVIT